MRHLYQIHINLTKNFTCLLYAVVLFVIFSPNIALSKDYKVEMLVFENLIEHQTYESYKQRRIKKVDPDLETRFEEEAKAEIWLIEPSMLLEEVSLFNESEDYLLLHHYSWGQESLDYVDAAIVDLIETSLSGSIKVYANQLLYINLDLDYKGYKLTEKRRIKLDEKHFFDHPKFGILMQVSRLEEEEEEDLGKTNIDSEE